MAGTQVRITGFDLLFSKGVPVAEFYQQLEALEGKEVNLRGGRTGVLYCDIKNDYIIGIIVSFTNDKKSIVTEKDSEGNLCIVKPELLKDQHNSNVTVFCINPDKRAGLFYNYFGGSSTAVISNFFRKAHNQARKSLVKERSKEIHANSKGMKRREATESAKEEFPGEFYLNIKVTKSDIDNLLSNFSSISEVQIPTSGLLENVSSLKPIMPVEKKSTVSVFIANSHRKLAKVSQYVRELAGYFGGYSREDALKLIGIGEAGQELHMALGDNRSEFGNMDYDDFVEKLPEEIWSHYQGCEAVSILLQKIKYYGIVFGTPSDYTLWKYKSHKDIQP